ncbi:MAG: hypothetical protein IKC13_01595 [Elusimicrobiaceae bacterium]|nr:hypothetical protein [Elusimicrobiaceae bacterium]
MKKTVIGLSVLLLTSACGSLDRQKATDFRAVYEKGEYCQASAVSLGTSEYCQKDSQVTPDDMELLDTLNGGSALFAAKAFANSDRLFAYSAKNIDEYEKASMLEDGGRAAVDILANASLHGYSPYIMDGIYTGAYLILGNLALGDKAGARIEVNRAYQKQKEASEVFRSEIKEQSEAAAKETQKLDKDNRKKAAKNEEEIIAKHYQDLKKWRAYKDFMNPYVTYLSGLYLLNNSSGAGDYENASMYMKRTAGMVPKNRTVLEDLQLAESYAGNKAGDAKNRRHVWVVFENGMVATLEALSLNIPVFLVSNELSMIAFSVPKPKEGKIAYPSLGVSLGGQKQVKTELLADVDAMFISEFNKRFPVILSKAIAATTFKAIMQYQIQKNDTNGVGSLIMAIYTIMTNQADLRSWQSLPKNVQVARLEVKDSGKLKLFAKGKEIAKINIPKDKNSLVYVRIPEPGVKPSVAVMEL